MNISNCGRVAWAAFERWVGAFAHSPVDEPIITKDEDGRIAAAVAEARRTLPVFWAKFDAQALGYDRFFVKVDVDGDNGGLERFWIRGIRVAGATVTGELLNQPIQLAGLRRGSWIEIDESRISDWQYAKDGLAYGHFTTRVLEGRANSAQRSQNKEWLAPQPLEAGTN